MRMMRAPVPLSPSSRPSVTTRSAADDLEARLVTMDSWKIHRLKTVYHQGRRTTSVQRLVQDLEMHRDDILAFFKDYAQLAPERLERERDAILAEAQAIEARQATEAEARAQSEATTADADSAEIDASPSTNTAKGLQDPRSVSPFHARGKAAALGGKIPPTPLKKDAERTLEMVYENDPFPSDEVLEGIYELHRLPRRESLAWFQQRREADGVQGGKRDRRQGDVDWSARRRRVGGNKSTDRGARDPNRMEEEDTRKVRERLPRAREEDMLGLREGKKADGGGWTLGANVDDW